jgi:hypothetical protein
MHDSPVSWYSPRRNAAASPVRREPIGASPRPLTVAALVCSRLVRLPAWFTVEQARKVVALRGVEYVLVEERGQVSSTVNRSCLWRAKGGDQLARCVRKSAPPISADTPIEQARALMDELGVECLPVVKDCILIGTVCLADIDFNLEGATALSA